MTVSYTNPKSAITRCRESLYWNFKQIQKSAGYLNSVGDIFFEPPQQADIKNYPAIVLLRGVTKVLNEDQSEQLWHKRIDYTCMVYLNDNTDPTLARETMMQDLEMRLGNNFMLNGEDGTETCRVTALTGDQPFGMVLNKPAIGFVFGFSVWLAQSIIDPSVAA